MSSIKIIIKILRSFANHVFLISQFSQALDEPADSFYEGGDGSRWHHPNSTGEFQKADFLRI